MITTPPRIRTTLASHRHARCTCAPATNLLPELRDLLHCAACTADPLLIYGSQDRLLSSFHLCETYRQSKFKTHSFRRRREAA
jgi:hypothetical protein